MSRTMTDDNQRPQKRARLESSSPATVTEAPNLLLSPPSTLTPSSSNPGSPSKLKPIPPAALLLSLPGLLAHPPNHRCYILSLSLSLNALRKCLSLPALSPEIECRAWTGLAEIGMKVISSGLNTDDSYLWALGIEAEVDKALGKAAIIAQKHPSLRPFKHHISLLQAQFSHWQHKTKFSRTQLRNLISSLIPTDPPYIVYSAYLPFISLLTSPHPPPSFNGNKDTTPIPLSSPAQKQSPQDIHAALSVVQQMEAKSISDGHAKITLLAHVLRLRILIAANMWSDVPSALQRIELAMGLSYEASNSPKTRKPPPPSTPNPKGKEDATFISFEDAFESAMVLHILMMAVVYYTHMGISSQASPRLSHLHALLDSGALEKFSDGIVQIELPVGPPVILQVTHPRILYLLGFLVSCVAKRDAVGRKPKRKVFAMEGLNAWEREVCSELMLPIWSSMGDVEEIEQRLARIKADLLCELAAVSIMRSEFDTAEETLANLISHTRTYALFDLFSSRITLHHAHLAHSLGQTDRAMVCYKVAEKLSEVGSFVWVSAKAGKIVLGLCERYGDPPTARGRGEKTPVRRKEIKGKGEMEGVEEMVDDEAGRRRKIVKEAKDVIRTCQGMGGTLEAIGHVLEACLSNEILKAKQHLKIALNLVTQSQDNHLRALVLALISSHYIHTAGEHAKGIFQTCEQLAAGLGAQPKDASANGTGRVGVGVVGNVVLGLWVGERFLELYRREGDEKQVKRQTAINAKLVRAVEGLKQRGLVIKEDLHLT